MGRVFHGCQGGVNKGAQAEIYDAKVEFGDGRKSPDYRYHVVKVMKGDCPLQAFQRP